MTGRSNGASMRRILFEFVGGVLAVCCVLLLMGLGVLHVHGTVAETVGAATALIGVVVGAFLESWRAGVADD